MDNSPETAHRASSQINVVIALLLLLAIITGLQAVKAYQQPRLPPVTKWEYKIGSEPDATLEATIKKLGAEGWEMVFARRVVDSLGANAKGQYEMIFRRPLPLNPGP